MMLHIILAARRLVIREIVWLGIIFAALDGWKRMEHCWIFLHDIPYLLEHDISGAFCYSPIMH